MNTAISALLSLLHGQKPSFPHPEVMPAAAMALIAGSKIE